MFKCTGLIVSILALLFLTSCRQEKKAGEVGDSDLPRVRLEGILENGKGASLYLEEMGAREYIPIDTMICDADGRFESSWPATRSAFYILRYENSAYCTLLAEPGEVISFKSNADNFGAYTIKNSPGSTLLSELDREHKKSIGVLADIARQNREALGSPGYAELKKDQDLQFDSVTSEFREYSLVFIHKNPSSPAILVALYNLYGPQLPVFDPGQDFEVYSFVDSLMSEHHPELEATQLLHAQVSKAKQDFLLSRKPAGIEDGQIAPDFVSSQPDGSAFALSELRGQYVLLSFWASWSHLSMEENATLKKAMKRYGNENFSIVQVSMDEQREAWTKQIEEDELDWIQLSDLKRWDSPLVELYGIERIPYNLIIGPSGKVLASDLYGNELLEKLELIIKQ